MTTITQIDTSTLSNQSLVTALLVHTFTNTTRARKVFVQVDLDQIAGNGNYVVYATIQRAGAGSAFRVIPITTAAVASGITSAAFQTAGFPLNSTDVLKVYVLGLAGDTTTPDIVTRVWEELPFSAAEYTAPPTAAQNADAVWDEARTDHDTAGTFGEKVNAELDSSSLTAIRDGLATAAAVQSVKDDTGATLPAQNTAIYNRLGVPAGASIAADIAGIESGGGGGGDATLANQQLILDRLSETTIGVTGYAQLDIYGVLQLKRGHTATLTFTSSTSNIVSDLSANTTKVFFGIKDAAGRSWLSIEGTKIVNTGLQSVRFTISAALAAAMINGEHFFDVVAVYGYNASTTPKYTSLEPFTSGRAKVTDLYVDI